MVVTNRKGSHLKHALALAVLHSVCFASMANGATFLVEPGVPPVDPETVLVNQTLTATFKVSLFDLDDRNVEHPVTGVRSEEYILTAGDSGVITAVNVPNGFAIVRTRDSNKVTFTRLGGSPVASFTVTATIKYLSPSAVLLDKLITLSGTVLFQNGATENKAATVKANVATVTFVNTSRGADRVVSMRIDAKNRGTKTINVVVTPDGTSATIETKSPRLVGEAFFKNANGNDTRTTTVSGTKTLTIYGGDFPSRTPRDARLEATVGNGAVAATWEFTVFYVSMKAFTEGEVSDVLPPSVTNALGKRIVDGMNEATADPNNPGKHLLGHHVVTTGNANDKAYGAIVVQGRIVPKGMDRADFNMDTAYSRFSHFNMDRTIQAREYNREGCFDARLGVFRAVSGPMMHMMSLKM